MFEKPVHICIADDDDDDYILFADLLREMKIAAVLTTALNGAELMATLDNLSQEKRLPDIIFLDLNMPVMNGIECLKMIKAEETFRQVPVVIYSMSAHKKAVDLAYKYGAALFFKKPDSISKLRRMLVKALDIYRNRVFSQPGREEFLIEL